MRTTKSKTTSNEAAKQHVRRRGGKNLCFCGCGEELPTPLKPSQTRQFLQGHDARLKSTVAKVEAGDAKISAIPRVARTNFELIGFMANFPGVSRQLAAAQ